MSKTEKMQSFLDWFKGLRSIHIITNEEKANRAAKDCDLIYSNILMQKIN